jgi:hypothetical protein
MVARLRDRYVQARQLVSPGAQGGHLEWILGPLRNTRSDGKAFEMELAQLVVLWLEDLTVELHTSLPAESEAPEDADANTSLRQRQLMVASLEAATRDFATAFLASPPAAVPA